MLIVEHSLMNDRIKQILKASPIGSLYTNLSQWRFKQSRSKLQNVTPKAIIGYLNSHERCVYYSKNIHAYSHILSPEEGNSLIANKIADDKPILISRFGNTELDCAYGYVKGSYKKGMIDEMIICSGFFPPQEKLLDQFSEIYLEASKNIDILGVWWFLPGEAELIRSHCPEAALINLDTLEPYYHDNPWSRNLKDKKVLVIHPFAKTISEQYKRHREVLFKNNDILPEFELMTFKSVQSIGGTKTEFNTWFDAYDWMRDQIKQYDFDIAIIGCGAYGLPLAAYIKSLGKKAVHLGGVTQILFGIRGKRWDERPFFQSLYNQYWTKPSLEEIPKTDPEYYDHKLMDYLINKSYFSL